MVFDPTGGTSALAARNVFHAGRGCTRNLGRAFTDVRMETLHEHVCQQLFAWKNQQGLARWFCTAGPLARCAGMSESDAGVDEPDSIKVFKCTAIRAPGLKSTWLPAVQTVAGDEYIKLSKWDRHLTHFVTSKPLNLHAGGGRPLNNINVQWFEDMCSLRLQACNAAVKQVIEQAADAEGVPRPAKIRAATQEDEFLCGRTIVVSAPAVVKEDVEIQAPRSLRLLWAVRGDLWLELTSGNLEYIRHAIQASTPYQQPVSKRAVQAKGSPGKKRRKRGRKPKHGEAADLPVLADPAEEVGNNEPVADVED